MDHLGVPAIFQNYCKKLNSLKHLVTTTVAESHKKALLLSSTSPFSQCANKYFNCVIQPQSSLPDVLNC